MLYCSLIPDDELPPDYRQALLNFGHLCISALQRERFYFTREELVRVAPESVQRGHNNVLMGFLVKTNVSISRSVQFSDVLTYVIDKYI